jgi:hypothetical protein
MKRPKSNFGSEESLASSSRLALDLGALLLRTTQETLDIMYERLSPRTGFISLSVSTKIRLRQVLLFIRSSSSRLVRLYSRPFEFNAFQRRRNCINQQAQSLAAGSSQDELDLIPLRNSRITIRKGRSRGPKAQEFRPRTTMLIQSA